MCATAARSEVDGEGAEDHERGGEAVGARHRHADDDDRAGQHPDARHRRGHAEPEPAAQVADRRRRRLSSSTAATRWTIQAPAPTAYPTAGAPSASAGTADDHHEDDVEVESVPRIRVRASRSALTDKDAPRAGVNRAQPAVPRIGSKEGGVCSRDRAWRGAAPYTCATARGARAGVFG